MDISRLEAVKVVELSEINGEIYVRADSGAVGQGVTLEDALRCMKSTASGELFLETTEYLLVEPECCDLLERLWGVVRPSCVICLLDGQGDLTSVGGYLDVRRLGNTLMDWHAGNKRLPTLRIREGRMNIVI